MLKKPLGGYFELEIPAFKNFLYGNALRFQSARAAFYSLLLVLRPKNVWMPAYICGDMLEPLRKAGVNYSFYYLSEDFSIKEKVDLGSDDILYYVNYFGVCSQRQCEILAEYGPDQVVFDHAQAFYQLPFDCLANIYSPRKFFGVPDGGLLVSSLAVPEPPFADQDSLLRSFHLLQRLNGEVEAGYSSFRSAEASLADFEPKRMSVLTCQILNGIDYELARIKRNENFAELSSALSDFNSFQFDCGLIDGPLCYPFLSDRGSIREILSSHQIYTPQYWPDCQVGHGTFEEYLVKNLVAIPCDQRYGRKDMMEISRVIHSALR